VNPAVAKVFAAYPPKLRQRLLAVRRMIFEVAKQTEGVGKLQETLKWGEPAYVTAAELKICIGMALTYHRKRAQE
jgi:hypothetical protein